MEKPKKLILDYSKWRCGEGGDYELGKGSTQLLNERGYMCCLGLWSQQLGASEEELKGKGDPNELSTLIPLFATEDKEVSEEYDSMTDSYTEYVETYKRTSQLAVDAIEINDKRTTTPEEKIEALTELLLTEGIELEVINKPS